MAFKATTYQPYDFANRRHIGPSPSEMDAMLHRLGVPDLETLLGQTVPASIRQAEPLDFGEPLSEQAFLAHMREIAAENSVVTSLIGQGYHGTVTPPVIKERAGKPGLVHGLHALPAGDQSGPTGGTLNFRHGLRPHR